MKQNILIGISFLMVLTIISCKKNSNPVDTSNTKATQIFPLSVGNRWIIQVTNYDTTGSIYYTEMDTIKIIGDTTIQYEKWFIGFGILTNRSDGLYDYEPGTSIEMSLKYKFPAAVDSIYIYRGTPSKVLSISDTVSVWAGNYVCYHYRQGFEGLSYNDFYLSPNVGLVKAEFYNPLTPGRVYKYMSYTLIKVIIK